MDGVEKARPEKWAVRSLAGAWQVLLDNDRWLNCHSEEEARIIASVPVLQFDALQLQRTDSDLARQLSVAADALDIYGIKSGSRFLRRRAELASGIIDEDEGDEI